MQHSSPEPDAIEPISHRPDRPRLRFGSDARGATAIEYGLIAAILAAMLISTLPLFNTSAVALYNRIANAMSAS